jgi:hypothetical protein
MSSTPTDLDALVAQKYQHGFVTDIESDTVPPGLDEDVIRLISRKKGEPQFLLDWRLQAYRHWLGMASPAWAHLRIAPIDYQAISYYSAPKARADAPKSLDEVDPKLLATYETERRPVGLANTLEAADNYARSGDIFAGVGQIEADGPDGEAARRRLHHQIPGGQTQIMHGGPIVLFVPGKLQTHDAQD